MGSILSSRGAKEGVGEKSGKKKKTVLLPKGSKGGVEQTN